MGQPQDGRWAPVQTRTKGARGNLKKPAEAIPDILNLFTLSRDREFVKECGDDVALTKSNQ